MNENSEIFLKFKPLCAIPVLLTEFNVLLRVISHRPEYFTSETSFGYPHCNGVTCDSHLNAKWLYCNSPVWPCLTMAVRMCEKPCSQVRPSLLVLSVSDHPNDMEQNSAGVYLKAM